MVHREVIADVHCGARTSSPGILARSSRIGSGRSGFAPVFRSHLFADDRGFRCNEPLQISFLTSRTLSDVDRGANDAHPVAETLADRVGSRVRELEEVGLAVTMGSVPKGKLA